MSPYSHDRVIDSGGSVSGMNFTKPDANTSTAAGTHTLYAPASPIRQRLPQPGERPWTPCVFRYAVCGGKAPDSDEPVVECGDAAQQMAGVLTPRKLPNRMHAELGNADVEHWNANLRGGERADGAATGEVGAIGK